ncbi:MAG: cupin domain-containing protein [Lysobacteraceae bacterium]
MSGVRLLFPSQPTAVAIDDAPAVDLGGGCLRRDLPAPPGVRAWVVEMAPGSLWPRIDRHDTGEAYFVLAGEVIESERRFGAGTQVVFAPGSLHRPRTEIGVRLLGFNLTAEAFLGAGGDPAALVGELHVPQG